MLQKGDLFNERFGHRILILLARLDCTSRVADQDCSFKFNLIGNKYFESS